MSTLFPSSTNPERSFDVRLPRSTSWIILFVVATLLVTGCDLFGSNSDESRVTTDVVVANSGNFGDQGGSLTLYSPTDSTATRNDINVAFINSVSLYNDRLFVVENTQSDNAGRITTFDIDQFGPIDQISGLQRPPRRIAFPSENKGYVTNLSRNLASLPNYDPDTSTVSVVDLEANSVTKRVDVGRLPEGIGVVAGKAFVANSGDGTLSVLSTESNSVTNTVSLPNCASPKSVFVDDENQVVVVCQGSTEQTPAVLFLDPNAEEVVSRVELSAPIGSINATQSAFYSEEAEELYAISGSQAFGNGTGEIFRVNTNRNALDASFAVPENESLIGISAVGYDVVTRDLYVTRLPVNDSGGPLFRADGTALVLDREGNVVTRFQTGNTPGYVTFLRETQ